MRKIIYTLFLTFCISALAGCSSTDSDTTCVDTLYCSANASTLVTCCSSTSCYYSAGSQTFYCDGTYCDSAAYDAAAYCLSKTAAKSEIDLATSLGLEKATNIQLQKSIDGMYIDLGKEVQQQ